jgi:hypothetical protein
MTPAVKKILTALAKAEGGVLALSEMRKAAGTTLRGHRIVWLRMYEAGLIERVNGTERPSMRITEAGLAAIGR